jgi:hypothetical protein
MIHHTVTKVVGVFVRFRAPLTAINAMDGDAIFLDESGKYPKDVPLTSIGIS